MSSLTKGNTDYWNKRLRRHVSGLTVAEFVLELNRHLRDEPAHAEVRFLITQTHTGQEVPSWTGPPEARPLISRVLQTVAKRVEMPAPFQMDPVDIPHRLSNDVD